VIVDPVNVLVSWDSFGVDYMFARIAVTTASGSDPIKAQLAWMIPSLPLRVLTPAACAQTNLPGHNAAALPRSANADQ